MEEGLQRCRKVYRSLGLESEEIRTYLAALTTLPEQAEQERPIVFIEAGIYIIQLNLFGSQQHIILIY